MSTPVRIHSPAAPAAIGPYSQAVEAGGVVYCSGQLGLDPATGALVAGGVRAEAVRVMENLRHVLAAAGLDFAAVVRCDIFLLSMDDFAAVNEVYGACFPQEAKPARQTVAVAALPKGGRVEVSCIAVRRA